MRATRKTRTMKRIMLPVMEHKVTKMQRKASTIRKTVTVRKAAMTRKTLMTRKATMVRRDSDGG